MARHLVEIRFQVKTEQREPHGPDPDQECGTQKPPSLSLGDLQKSMQSKMQHRPQNLRRPPIVSPSRKPRPSARQSGILTLPKCEARSALPTPLGPGTQPESNGPAGI